MFVVTTMENAEFKVTSSSNLFRNTVEQQATASSFWTRLAGVKNLNFKQGETTSSIRHQRAEDRDRDGHRKAPCFTTLVVNAPSTAASSTPIESNPALCSVTNLQISYLNTAREPQQDDCQRERTSKANDSTNYMGKLQIWYWILRRTLRLLYPLCNNV
jgi:hypothetical protein